MSLYFLVINLDKNKDRYDVISKNFIFGKFKLRIFFLFSKFFSLYKLLISHYL